MRNSNLESPSFMAGRFKYIFLLVFRVVVVALLPLSAWMLLIIEKKSLARSARSEEEINFLSR